MAALIRAPVQRARRRQSAAFTAPVTSAVAATSVSAHRFADVDVRTDPEPRIVVRAAVPLRYGIAPHAGGFEASQDDVQTVRGDEMLRWSSSLSLDLLEMQRDGERVVAVKAVDLGLEPFRTADGIERGLAPLLEQMRAMLRFSPAKHVLHLELSGEPSKDQLEGLARLRDAAQRRARETAIDLEVDVAAPNGRPALRPPKP